MSESPTLEPLAQKFLAKHRANRSLILLLSPPTKLLINRSSSVSQLFGYFLSIGRIPQSIITAISAAELSRWWVILLIMAMLIVLGIFMDQLAVMVLTLPLIFPVIVELGFDPVWYAIIHCKTVELGMITPPFGLNVYVIQGVTNV